MPDDPEPVQRARALVLAHGWNSTAYQIVNPGIEHWFAAAGDAVAGVLRQRRVWVVAGAPVCPAGRLAAVAAELERDAARAGARICYLGAEARLEAVYQGDAAHASLLLGAMPVWAPADWAAIIAARASLRAQLNRARNKGVGVTEWPAGRAAAEPALRACLERWLGSHGLPPLQFLVESHTLDRLLDRRVFVAERAGSVVGFLVASPVPERRGWLVEQIVREPAAAPNGTAELLVDAAMRAFAADGAAYATLGTAPLSRRAGEPAGGAPLPIRLTVTWLRAHFGRFYNFEGLDAFKAKFQPVRWDPIFAIANEPRLSAGTLHAVAAAYAGGSLVAVGARALARAARTEARWLVRRLPRAAGPG